MKSVYVYKVMPLTVYTLENQSKIALTVAVADCRNFSMIAVWQQTTLFTFR